MANRSVKIAISLPARLFQEVERRRRRQGRSRSALLAEALEGWIARAEREEKEARHEEGYRRYPETEREIRAAERSAADLLGEVPWE